MWRRSSRTCRLAIISRSSIEADGVMTGQSVTHTPDGFSWLHFCTVFVSSRCTRRVSRSAKALIPQVML